MQRLAIAIQQLKMPILLGKTGVFSRIRALPVTLEAAGSSPVTLAFFQNIAEYPSVIACRRSAVRPVFREPKRYIPFCGFRESGFTCPV
jgi:hypothetical protein